MSITNRRFFADANRRGALWMCAAMAGFALEDTLIKAAAQVLPIGQILVMFGLFGAALFAMIAILRGDALFSRAVVSAPMRWRVAFEVMGRVFYTLAITLTPLSAATVILQATPLVVVAGAALFFGEQVGPRRWGAIALGLIGVLIIVQPGAESFSPLSIFAVLGLIGFAGRDLASRAAPASLSAPVLGVYGFLPMAACGAAFAMWEGTPFVRLAGITALQMTGVVVMGVAAYGCLMTAMRTGDVSAVTPFRYTRLIFGIALGVMVFGENLSPAMILGCALIVASGLFILLRGRVRA